MEQRFDWKDQGRSTDVRSVYAAGQQRLVKVELYWISSVDVTLINWQ